MSEAPPDSRDPPVSSFTTNQRLVLALASTNMPRREIALRLHLQEHNIDSLIRVIDKKIPGRGLRPRQKIIMWSRGCTRSQMMGWGWIPEHRR